MRKCSGQIIHVKLLTPRSYVRENYFSPLIDRFSQMIVCLRLIFGMRETINENCSCADPESGGGGQGVGAPPEISQKIQGFLAKLVRIP